MSLKATQWGWKQRQLKPTQKLVLLNLADRADDDETCWPSQSNIAKWTGLDTRTVRRIVADLEKHGLIQRQPRYHANTGNRSADFYTLNLDDDYRTPVSDVRANGPEVRVKHTGSTDTRPAGQPDTPPGKSISTESVKESTKEPPKKRLSASKDTDEFVSRGVGTRREIRATDRIRMLPDTPGGRLYGDYLQRLLTRGEDIPAPKYTGQYERLAMKLSTEEQEDLLRVCVAEVLNAPDAVRTRAASLPIERGRRMHA